MKVKLMELFKRCYRLSLLCLIFVALMGCQSTVFNTGSTPFIVGPGGPVTAANKAQKNLTYNSNIHLDVAVPIFNPGLPMKSTGALNYEKMSDDNIWPQLRRAEAKIFAVETKKSLDKIGAFGSVNVTPNSNASADLYILGTINKSNSEDVSIKAMVMDSTGKIWGNKTFNHRVSEGFFRDARNSDANPYGPVYDKLAEYVFKLLSKKSEVEKNTIRDITNIRYAQSYSPESYSQYLVSKTKYGIAGRHVEFNLTGKPADNDPMMSRIDVLHNQENMFMDRLQSQYLAFGLDADKHYRLWQKETLPEAVTARKVERKRNVKAVVGALAMVGAVLAASNSNSPYVAANTTALAVVGVAAVGSAFKDNEQLSIHKATLDEMGESLDITLSPSVMMLDEKTVELTGSAADQHEQWKEHLHNIYEIESGNLQAL
jgi:hypothetical protein